VPHILAGGDVIGREVGSQMATPVDSQGGGLAAHNAFADGEPSASIIASCRARFSPIRR
jgi:pyruvate/2-oxoglutarate dehydrogenase complex dihydrolipoamide dehydrogenase (E3) component